MPSKGAKRALSAEAGLESKRLKETLKGYGVSKACYDAVAEAVELSELPEFVAWIPSAIESVSSRCVQK